MADAPEIRCAHCQTVIHEEDGWWLDEYDDLTCWGNDGEDDLGPHVPPLSDSKEAGNG